MRNYLLQFNSNILSKKYSLHFRLMSILFLLMIPAIISGPFLADLFCVILGFSFLIISFKNKLWIFYRNIFVIIILFFSIYILLRSLFAQDIIHSLESSLFYFRFIFFALAVQYILIKNNLLIKYFLEIFIIVFSIVIFDGYIQYFFNYNLLFFESPEPDRLSGFFREEMILGSFISRFFPFLFCFLIYFNSESKIRLVFFVILLIASDILVYLSGERSAFFYVLLTTFAAILLIKKLKFLRIFTFIISILFIILVTVIDQTTRDRMINQTITEFHELDENKKIDLKFFTKTHEEHFLTAYKMFQNNILFGQGPKMFRKLCDQPPFDNIDSQCMTENNTNHPHNTYFQLLAETGIIGFIFIFPIFCLIVYVFFRQFISIYFLNSNYVSDYRLTILFMLFISLWPIIPTGSFFNNWLSVVYYLPVGFILADIYKYKINDTQK